MNKSIYAILLYFPALVFAQGCVMGEPPKYHRYVCIDGRSMSEEGNGVVWNAKRGCFLSTVPCCAYEAQHFAYSLNSGVLHRAYESCRRGYPYHLGEMQTH